MHPKPMQIWESYNYDGHINGLYIQEHIFYSLMIFVLKKKTVCVCVYCFWNIYSSVLDIPSVFRQVKNAFYCTKYGGD